MSEEGSSPLVPARRFPARARELKWFAALSSQGPRARSTVDTLDRPSDVPGVECRLAGDPRGAAAIPRIEPPADAKSVHDWYPRGDVLYDS